jgi:hypothetical protein
MPLNLFDVMGAKWGCSFCGLLAAKFVYERLRKRTGAARGNGPPGFSTSAAMQHCSVWFLSWDRTMHGSNILSRCRIIPCGEILTERRRPGRSISLAPPPLLPPLSRRLGSPSRGNPPEQHGLLLLAPGPGRSLMATPPQVIDRPLLVTPLSSF